MSKQLSQAQGNRRFRRTVHLYIISRLCGVMFQGVID